MITKKSYSWGNHPKTDSKYYEFEFDDHSSIFKKKTQFRMGMEGRMGIRV